VGGSNRNKTVITGEVILTFIGLLIVGKAESPTNVAKAETRGCSREAKKNSWLLERGDRTLRENVWNQTVEGIESKSKGKKGEGSIPHKKEEY